ncbi:hypothetical protein LM13656_180004 [Listeria monocytogenes]|nr:hypothetical protein LMntsn_0903 [Listeria monocytogenes]CUK29152.1 hypothetical protein LM1000505_150201 [Listeria monocytogenes]CUK30772.1 hypothetical protein LM500008_100114 [Listeria monocytogenes]CUK34973.1 hypothetical protein LM13656_180004 [Listeria monocytogenes]CUK35366.1 hypothetical protein LM500172_100112 [Listeria monocytogenes]
MLLLSYLYFNPREKTQSKIASRLLSDIYHMMKYKKLALYSNIP